VQPIEKLGLWWLPEVPNRKSFGTLSYNDEGEIPLSVVGELGRPGSQDRLYPAILGHLDSDGHVQRVTLRDCFLTKRSFSSEPGVSRQEFFSHRAYFGEHLQSEEDLTFQIVSLSFSGLPSWASNLTGFREGDGLLSVTWNHPDSIGGDVQHAQFLLGVGCSWAGGGRKRRIEEYVDVNVTLTDSVSESRLQSEYVYPLQNFLTFATDRPNALTKF
jgi:hypothetical protein